MLNKIQSFQPYLDGTQLRIGVVMSRFNEAICLELRDACFDELVKLGVAAEDIVLATVPGALEIPHALGLMADSDEFDALIALGAIVRGETYHFELVANESGRGISLVASGYNLPVLNAVLTTENEEQAHARTDIKAREVARAAVEMANLTDDVRAVYPNAADLPFLMDDAE